MRTTTLLTLALSSLALSCASANTPSIDSSSDPSAGDGAPSGQLGGDFPPVDAATASATDAPASDPPPDDAGAPAEASDDDAGPADASPAPIDASVDAGCPGALGAGDLAIVELMVESVAGAGDHGEWVEVVSTRDCALNLHGLHGEAPVGAKVNAFDVVTDLWIPPRGTFIVADSLDAAINHDLPGTLIAWNGKRGDVLRNLGGTVTLRTDVEMVDSVTFPKTAWTVGATLSYPSDCDLEERTDWTRWKTSTWSWFPGFLGTPNAANADVTCE